MPASTSDLRAVIFDFGGVLCHFPPPSQTAELAAAAGAPHEEFLRAFWGNRIPYDAGALTAKTYWAKIAAQLGNSYSSEQVRDFVRHDIGFWSNFDGAMLDWVDAVRGAGIRTALLSNLPPDLGEHLRALPGFLDRFDHVTYSYEVGSVKPDSAIYRHCLDGLALAAEQTLFLDDRPENIAGARALGIQAIEWTSRAKGAGLLPDGLPPLAAHD
ncbi:MAG: HAD family phosphatase [Bryobacteraceae bacterium]